MGFYRDKILPGLINRVCGGAAFDALRAPLISSLKGVGLELGVGSGFNLVHYSGDIKKLYAIDPCKVSLTNAKRLADSLNLPLETLDYKNEYHIPIEDHSLDFVVTTWTLCTIPEVIETLREMRRVLRPSGCYYFLEHGLAPDRFVAGCQNLLNPIQKSIGGGCHLNRQIDSLIVESGFKIEKLDCFYMDAIKIGAFMYQGRAVAE